MSDAKRTILASACACAVCAALMYAVDIWSAEQARDIVFYQLVALIVTWVNLGKESA